MTWLLPRIVGLGHALHLTLLGEPIDAGEAQRIGFVCGLTHPDSLHAEAERIAAKIASYPRIGIGNAKAEFHAALKSSFEAATTAEHEGEVACLRDPEVRARLRGFVERKRK